MDNALAYSPLEGDMLLNVAQCRDALDLLRALPAGCAPLAFFDPQHRGVLDRLKFGNEGARQRRRAKLPAMSEAYIDACCREIARALAPGGYLMLWIDTFGLCEGHHLRIAAPPEWLIERRDKSSADADALKVVDLIAWDFIAYRHGQALAPARRLSACLAEASGRRADVAGPRNPEPVA